LIGVGFSSKSASLNRAPGWEPESWGYHGDDGHCFQAQNVGKQYGPTFGYGDVIGCGVNFRTGTAFFTKNGHYLGKFDKEKGKQPRVGLPPGPTCPRMLTLLTLNPGIAFREVKGKLYPSVGLKKTGEHVRVNFGQTPFMFDIDSVMKACSAKPQSLSFSYIPGYLLCMHTTHCLISWPAFFTT
jgi:hypothetical protein